MPPTILNSGQFDLIVGWSIFSHLSEMSATAWLGEFSRLMSPGGAAVMTTWGMRFLARLKSEADQARNGQEIHWYSQICIAAAGDIEARIAEYTDGKFVWFTGGDSKLYGEAFISEAALRRIIAEQGLPLAVEVFDSSSLAQDVFVLRRI